MRESVAQPLPARSLLEVWRLIGVRIPCRPSPGTVTIRRLPRVFDFCSVASPAREEVAISQVRTRPSSDDAHEVVFFRRHSDDDPGRPIPGREFLNGCPVKVRAAMRAVLALDNYEVHQVGGQTILEY